MTLAKKTLEKLPIKEDADLDDLDVDKTKFISTFQTNFKFTALIRYRPKNKKYNP